MQKLITVSVNTKDIKKSADSPFTINEVDGLNEWLALGWEIEEWDFLKEAGTDGEIVLLVILNDNSLYDEDDDDFFDGSFDADEDEEEEDEEDNFGQKR
ncbi:MAG: hypothetical protein ABIN67_23290 [Ferruginibacter sp.]